MKALSVLGTSSNSGKSWFATALCAWLRRKGIRVAPFKAQNMSNNSYVTLSGGEIGRAQGVQAEACGLLPRVEMNPILLKPSGELGIQLIVLGRAHRHLKAGEYYREIEHLWQTVEETLEYWKQACDVLIVEGAGSPVELNLLKQDIVNLRPVRHLDGRWLLISDIERGGVFAQIVGTWNLMESEDQVRGLGVVVNKFRGDLSLFSEAADCLSTRTTLPLLGTLPYRKNLQPENEDSLCREADTYVEGATIGWINFPNLSNSQDSQAWKFDQGVGLRWVEALDDLVGAQAIVLPGTKNTLADLEWLHRTGLGTAIQRAARTGVPVVGICGGYQMLGDWLSDLSGVAGDAGMKKGLELLPVSTIFEETKQVRQVEALWKGDRWTTYEIHMGKTTMRPEGEPFIEIQTGVGREPEGCRKGKIWGTYLHGIFESSAVRASLAANAGFRDHKCSPTSWRETQRVVYAGMADLLDEYLNMETIWEYVAH